MEFLSKMGTLVAEQWPVWLLTAVLIAAATIDAIRFRVPNWLTYSLVIGGWVYSTAAFGWEGLGWSLWGTAVGFALLFPAYAIGGMGAGDVKLFAGVGAWLHAAQTWHAFCVSAVGGGLIAISLVVWRRDWRKHWNQFQMIFFEVMTIRDPEALSVLAAERKDSMALLPYAVPIMLGTVSYLAWSGQLI
ncbi:MAG TPA: A24 family peptidase [Candidatus Anammoximicrobium sp.]|nr:A24 family peptidase [Candidatus Anammoximicrobium sp.]